MSDFAGLMRRVKAAGLLERRLAANPAASSPRVTAIFAHNARRGWPVDFAVGGLNYQIEHHLFRACRGRTCAAARPS